MWLFYQLTTCIILKQQGNIQTLTASDLDKYKAHMHMHGFFLLHGKVSLSRRFIVALSAPFQYWFIDQPHIGLQKHSADARAFSFIKILNLMQNMSYPPQMLYKESHVNIEKLIGI